MCRRRFKSQIDGDNRADRIPNLLRQDVELRWQADKHWSQFQPHSTRPPDEQRITLKRVGGESIEVPVNMALDESVVAIDVDGWPRAIRYTIEHDNGARGKEKSEFNTIDFASVAMAYGKKPPGNEGDDPVADTTYHYPDQGSWLSWTRREIGHAAAGRLFQACLPEAAAA